MSCSSFPKKSTRDSHKRANCLRFLIASSSQALGSSTSNNIPPYTASQLTLLTQKRGWLDNTPGGERTRVHHNLRMVIQYGTLSAFTRGEYSLEDGTKVQLDLETIKERVLKTKLYKEAVHLELSPQYNTTISVIEGSLPLCCSFLCC